MSWRSACDIAVSWEPSLQELYEVFVIYFMPLRDHSMDGPTGLLDTLASIRTISSLLEQQVLLVFQHTNHQLTTGTASVTSHLYTCAFLMQKKVCDRVNHWTLIFRCRVLCKSCLGKFTELCGWYGVTCTPGNSSSDTLGGMSCICWTSWHCKQHNENSM